MIEKSPSKVWLGVQDEAVECFFKSMDKMDKWMKENPNPEFERLKQEAEAWANEGNPDT